VELYLIVKTLHVLSAAVLFGTGAGIAFFMLKGQMSGVPAARQFAASTTVTADFLFTLPAVLIQPLSGAWLVWRVALIGPTGGWFSLTDYTSSPASAGCRSSPSRFGSGECSMPRLLVGASIPRRCRDSFGGGSRSAGRPSAD
jgi:hypothetical protein